MSYPSYPEYEDSGFDWLGKVPSHWWVIKPKHLVILGTGGNQTKSNVFQEKQEDLYPAFSASGQDVWMTDWLYQSDALVLSAVGARCGKTFMASGRWNVVANTQVLLPSSKADIKFLWYLTNNQEWWEIGGAAQPYVLTNYTLNRNWVFPPPVEQTQIARFLDHQTARIDALIAEQQRLIELLKEKRQAVISHAVTKGLDPDVTMKDSGVEWLGEVPEHWSTGRVGWWFDVELGKMLDESRITGESLAPYIRNTDVQWNGINTEDLPVMDFDEADRIRYGLRKGDLLVCEGGEIGRAAIWQNDDFTCFYQKALHRVRARKEGNVHFLKHVLRHYADNGILDGSSTSATINHFTREQFRALSIPFPPAGEQAEIADYIDSKSNDFDALEEQANVGIELLKERRSALISAAVTGKIDVRDWQRPSSETFPEASVSEGATA